MMGYSYDPVENRRQALLNELNSLNMASQQNPYPPNQPIQFQNQIPQQNQMPQQNQAPMQQYFILGKVVSSIEEARSIPCPADGSTAYFPCPLKNEIYAMQIGNDGKISVTTYCLKANQAVPPSTKVNTDQLKSLEDRVKSLEERLAAIEGKSNE